jgi:hypothetical protein
VIPAQTHYPLADVAVEEMSGVNTGHWD